MRWANKHLATAVLAAALAGCGGGDSPGPGPASAGAAAARELPLAPTALSPAAALGKRMFFDASLSASGAMSCATCHDPAHAHGGGKVAGVLRATPSLRYLSFVPTFGFDANGAPHGGYDWDGRARTLGEQAEHPLLAANEMSLLTRASAVAKLRATVYAGDIRAVYGDAIFDNVDSAFGALLHSLEQYQLQDLEFRRFDSKYDAVTAGHATFDDAELRGLAHFDSACATCHPRTPAPVPAAALFTTFGYGSSGIPTDANDGGLCGPLRTDITNRPDLCGTFRVPGLRNVARRAVFFHDGGIADLATAVRLHAPQPVTARDADDIVRFLRTLDDGWRPPG